MAQNPNKVSRFWLELKRRKVVRVITVYAAAAFVVLELTDIVAPSLGLPVWTLNLIIILLCVGFIIAVILSWLYDIGPEGGLEKTSPIISDNKEEKSSSSTGWKIATYLSALTIIVIVVFFIASRIISSSNISKLEKSIAVLPFENWSHEEAFSHLGDAMADEIILELQYIKEFDRILSRTSTLQYKNSEKSIPEIASELGVNYIIEGSIQPQKKNVSVRVQVIRGIKEDHIWAEEFNGKWSDIFDIQDEIAKKVARELRAVLSPEEIERLEKKPTDNIEAYDLYLLGRHYWNMRSEDGIRQSIQYFQKAIELDDQYALAYAGLADAYYVSALWSYLEPEEALHKALAYAQKSVSLDDQLAEAYATLAALTKNIERNHEKSTMLYQTALRLNSNAAGIHHWLGLDLTQERKFQEASLHINLALELDPLSVIINYGGGFVYYHAGEWDNALKNFNATIELNPQIVNHRFWMFLCYMQKGQMARAMDEYEKYLVNEPLLPIYKDQAKLIYDTSGKNGFLNFIIDLELQKSKPITRNLAILYAYSGNKEKALDYMELNTEEFGIDYLFMYSEPAFIPLRSEPRFIAIAKELGFEE